MGVLRLCRIATTSLGVKEVSKLGGLRPRLYAVAMKGTGDTAAYYVRLIWVDGQKLKQCLAVGLRGQPELKAG